jgi:dTDP-4-amino-4,6-dideoxygalactose transaminase
VITTPLTFAATAEVVRYFNARPVFVDVEPDSLNIDINQIERAITPRTKAISRCTGGSAVNMSAVCSIAHERGIKVIEDAAHSLPTVYNHRQKTPLAISFALVFMPPKR